MKTVDHFSMIAPFYEHLARRRPAAGLATALKLPAEGCLMDAGGGTGRIAIELAPLVSKTVVLDPARGMLHQVRKKDRLQPLCGAAEALPFKNDVFARIVVIDALHHFRNQSAALLELWRILKPGGRMLIEEPDIDHILVKGVAFLEKLLCMRSRFLSSRQIIDIFKNHNIPAGLRRCARWYFHIVVDKPGSISH